VHVGATLGRWVAAVVRHRRRGRLLSLVRRVHREEMADGPAVQVGSGQITVAWAGTVDLG
jgi:hypothetical protein